MLCDEEVADDYSDQDDEDLDEGDVEVADHVQFGEGVLGCLADVTDRMAGLAEGLRVHDGADMAVLAQVLAQPLVAETTVTVAARALLLQLVHQDVKGLGDVGQDPAEHYRAAVPHTKTQARPEVIA